MNTKKYIKWLKTKIEIAPESGFDIELNEINDICKPHQKDVIKWAVKGGRRALFESFGLGKTIQQLEILRIILKREGGKGLVVCPLGVRQEFKHDANVLLNMDVEYIKTQEDIDNSSADILISNYEPVRDGKIDPAQFTVVSLDEASVLRSYGSKTYQTFLQIFKGVKYKFVCTATPSPNKFKELIHYAGYLEVMDTGQALTRFFQRDSTQANNLTLYPHKEKEFWLWMSTWAVFITTPSDLGYSDEGYNLPEMEVRYHKVDVDHSTAGFETDGQGKMFRDAALGLKDASKEKKDSIRTRIDKMVEILKAEPDNHFLLWHSREEERHVIKKAWPETVDVYGSQDMDLREKRTIDFAEGRIKYFASKSSISGSGSNFQRFCHRAIFVGIDYKFNDFIQSIFRIQRFLQKEKVIIDIIYTESEQTILDTLLKKWEQHKKLQIEMTNIIKEYGLSSVDIISKLARTIGCERKVVKGKRYAVVLNDTILETANMKTDSVDMLLTSIPFGNHYEYSPSYNDLGHNTDNDRFFEQMDFLSPELLRVLKPGRVFACHTKDRIQFGNTTGYGMPSVDPFHCDTINHYRKHGFIYFGMITVITDVVRENNQTYRLGWTENSKDGTKMGVGSPEYILLFRKLPTDTTKAYADVKVAKSKKDYTRGQWQLDAHAFWRSSGERLLTSDDFKDIPVSEMQKLYRTWSRKNVYNYEKHIELAETLEDKGSLPASFMVIAPGSWSNEVWDDVNRMLTLNTEQTQKQKQNHICLSRDSLVLIKERGYVPIQDVKIGEHTLTHKGRWKKVLVVRNTGKRKVVEVKAQGVPGITLTPDHKLWARDSRKYQRVTDYISKVEPQWIESQNTLGTYVNRKLPPIQEPVEKDLTTWWIVGRWIADGHIDATGGACISCGRHEKVELSEKLSQYGGKPFHDTGTALQILLKDKNRRLRNILADCGKGAKNKRIPPQAFTLPVDQAKALIDGYLSGDGHYLKERKRWTASSVSRELLLGISFLAQRVYNSIASVYPGRLARIGKIQGRTVNMKADYILGFDIPHNGRRKKQILLPDGAWMRVRHVDEKGEAETWNLRIEDDESYTAEGLIVKNCPLQFDIVDRLIDRYSNKGDIIHDPFGGIMTVPYRAIKKDRKGTAVELNAEYFNDGIPYLKVAELEILAPTLFDLEEIE